MPTSVTVNDLKINELTEAQYDAAVQGGVIGEHELSMITDLTDKAVQVSALPTASATELGNIYQYVGATDANYTNGYFYKCVSDGQEPATYSWTRVDVQPAPVIPDPLPSQTGQSGKFLTTDGTDASWSDKPLVNASSTSGSLFIGGATSYNIGMNSVFVGIDSQQASNSTHSVAFGNLARVNGSYTTALGASTFAFAAKSIAIGYTAQAVGIGSIQINASGSLVQNTDANTFKVANANGNFEIMSADGTIPADRLASTTGLADGNYRLRLVMASGVPTLEWVAE